MQGSIFLDRRRKRPEQIITLGNNMVVVTTKGSVLFVYDAKSAPPQLVRKFDVFSATQLLGKDPQYLPPLRTAYKYLARQYCPFEIACSLSTS